MHFDFSWFTAGNICYLPMIEGPCRGFILQWFYNLNTSRCEQFVYGGCGGNANRFNTKAKCQQRCAGMDTSRLIKLFCAADCFFRNPLNFVFNSLVHPTFCIKCNHRALLFLGLKFLETFALIEG